MKIEKEIRSLLIEKIQCEFFDLKNESFMHHVPEGSETHFRLIVVSKEFENLKLLQRHRLVQQRLKEPFSMVKAVHLNTLTPSEWSVQKGNLLKSPTCVQHE